MTECRRFRIEGRVQGVWFRESTRQQAVALDITGYARNCPDGSVEVLACGTPQAIAELHAWLRVGPRLAQVRRVEDRPADGPAPETFLTS
jgi:acylphosphatase